MAKNRLHLGSLVAAGCGLSSLISVLAACSGPTLVVGQTTGSSSTGANATGGAVISQVIGPGGGSVIAPDGTSVQIPATALSINVTVTLTPSPSVSGPSGMSWVGTPYTFGPEGQQFAAPVLVVMPFSPGALPAGVSASWVVIETAPAGSLNYVSLGGSLVDARHVRASTMHFSTFGPSAPEASGPDGGTSGSTSSGASSGGSGGSTGTSSTATGGEAGTTGGGSGSDAGCLGAVGCAVVTVLNGPGSGGNGAGLCQYPFLSGVEFSAQIADSNSTIPPAANQLVLTTGDDVWQIGVVFSACPGPDGGTFPARASVQFNPQVSEYSECTQSPYVSDGTIDFAPVDNGYAGTFETNLFGGMQATFTLDQDGGTCTSAALDAGLVPDAGSTSCDSSSACLDGGPTLGVGGFSLSDPGLGDENWCNGPLLNLRGTATETSAALGAPVITVDVGQGAWTIEADLSCCPLGPGALPATINLTSSACEPAPGIVNTPLFGAAGTVIFSQIAGGLVGWISVEALDGGNLSVFASFDFSDHPPLAGDAGYVAYEQVNPGTIALAPSDGGSRVFWSNAGANGYSTPGAIQELLPDGGWAPYAAGVDGATVVSQDGYLFWTQVVGTSGLVAMAPTPSPPTDASPAIVLLDGGFPFALAIDSNSIFFLDAAEKFSGQEAVKAIDFDGGAVRVLSTGMINMQGYMTLDSDYVYWTDSSSDNLGRVYRVPKVGGSTQTLAQDQTGPEGIAVDSSFVYWVTNDNDGFGGLWRASLDGGSPQLMAAVTDAGTRQYGLAIDSDNAYWNSGPGILAIPLSGGSPSYLEGNLPTDQIEQVAVDNDYVYWSWVGETNGGVARVHK